MKILGDASHIFGMCIVRDRDEKLLYLSQSEYIEKVLKCFNMEREKASSTPLPPYVKLCQNDCPKSDVEKVKMAKVPYSFVVGSLMYVMICTRPDIAYVVGGGHVSNPSQSSADAVGGRFLLREIGLA